MQMKHHRNSAEVAFLWKMEPCVADAKIQFQIHNYYYGHNVCFTTPKQTTKTPRDCDALGSHAPLALSF